MHYTNIRLWKRLGNGNVSAAGLVFLALLVYCAGGCGNAKSAGGSDGKAEGPVLVRIAEAIEREAPVELDTVGAVEPYATITVKAQVSGELTQVLFKEGDMVAAGQTIFSIDAQPYDAALEEAESNLARTRAGLEAAKANVAKSSAQARNADAIFNRDKILLQKGMVPEEEYEQVRAAAEAARAAVSADQAAVKSAEESVRGAEAAVKDARLALGYCTIQSPLSGRTGSLLVDRGNLVKANDTALVVINQLQPIYVGFSMPERYLSRIRQSMQERSLEVKVVVPHDDAPAATGALTFINNTVDPATGTIGCKATFDNDDERLWPGQFVNVSLEVAVHANALVVPTQAVQMGQSGPYTYVVKPDLTAELRTLKVGAEQNGMTIVEEGVQLGEKVVTDGQLRLAPGKTVQIVDGSAE